MSSGSYRYGFNGQEKSDEIKGGGNSYTAEFWEYDTRLGRRWNVDMKPITGISVYSAFANNPNYFTDFKGDTSKFFGNDGGLIYQNNKGKGNDLYVVANEQFKSLSSKFQNKDKLTSELIKVGIVAYANQDAAAASWAPDGFAATKGDPHHFERASRIFHTRAYGDQKISDIYVVGSTVIGQKSTEKGVSQEVNPELSTISLNGIDISNYSLSATETRKRNGLIVSQRQIVYQNWNVSAMVHTHNPGHDKYSISTGDIMYGGGYGGDYGIAADGISVYLVPTTKPYAYIMFRLDLMPQDRTNYFRGGVSEAQEFMRKQQKTIYLK